MNGKLLETHTNCSSLFIVLNYKSSLMPALLAVVSTCKLKEPTIQPQKI